MTSVGEGIRTRSTNQLKGMASDQRGRHRILVGMRTAYERLRRGYLSAVLPDVNRIRATRLIYRRRQGQGLADGSGRRAGEGLNHNATTGLRGSRSQQQRADHCSRDEQADG